MAKYQGDDNWYRGEVIAIDPKQKTAEVKFVDYGNSQVCSFDSLKVIEEEFVEIPPQAYCCFLNCIGTRAKYSEDAKLLESLTANKVDIQAKFGSKIGSKYPVRLVEKCEGGVGAINSYFGAPDTADVPAPSTSYTLLPTTKKITLACYENLAKFYLTPLNLNPYQVTSVLIYLL